MHVLRESASGAPEARTQCLTSADGCAIDEALHEDQARVRFSMQQVWGELASL